jgi:hypothetical protein
MMLVLSELVWSSDWYQCPLLDIFAKYEPSSDDKVDKLIDPLLNLYKNPNSTVSFGVLCCTLV